MSEMQERAEHLRAYLDENDIEVRKKSETPAHWFHAITLFLGSLFVSEFNTHFATAIGKTIYLPVDMTKNLAKPDVYRIVRHEIVHCIDYIRFGLWYKFSWTFLLPAVFTMRAYWEERGYTQTLLTKWELFGYINEGYEIEQMVRRFCGKTYLWMNPFQHDVEMFWANKIQQIKDGEVTGYYPYSEEYNAEFER